MKYIPGRMNRGYVSLPWWLQEEGEPEPDEKDDQEEFIEGSVLGIQAQKGPEKMRRYTACILFVRLRIL